MARQPCFLLALLAGFAAPIAGLAAQPVPTDARPLGPERLYRGVHVTNFEIGYFFECETSRGDCDDWEKRELRWLSGGTPGMEARLMACIARWNGSRDRWALYAIAFRGRETLDRQPKTAIHDTERRVLLDDIVALELIGTDNTIAWTLPRYRRQPRMTC